MTKLWEALDILDGGRVWRKGTLHHNDRVCTLGALQAANYGMDALANANVGYPENDDPDLLELEHVIKEQFPKRVKGVWHETPVEIVAEFNDHRDTTYDDVALVLEKASIRRDEILS